jgi:hypothetical protein
MAQNDMNVANQGFPAFRADLNDQLEALVTNSSGATAPATTFPHQWWLDTSTTPSTLRQRNAANDAWIVVGLLNQSTNTFNVPVAQGGTGAADAGGARTNLGALAATDPSYTGTLTGGTGVINIGSGQLYKDASGNVGIGTSSQILSGLTSILSSSASTQQLVVADTTAYNANPTASINFATKVTAGGGFGNNGYIRGAKENTTDSNFASYLSFATTTSGNSTLERMRIDSSGNVLVGTTSSFNANDGSDPSGIAFQFSGTAARPLNAYANDGSVAAFKRAGSDGTLLIFSRGGVGTVGTISVTTSATAYNTSSDYRLKEDWQPMSGAITRLNQLKPVNFAWKVDGSRVDGFLAHEAQEVVPEAVTGTKDAVDAEGNPEYQGIDQSKLVPLLTAALQEAVAEINALKARLDAANL